MIAQDAAPAAASWARVLPAGAGWRDALLALGVMAAFVCTDPAVLSGTGAAAGAAAAGALAVAGPLAMRRFFPVLTAGIVTPAFIVVGTLSIGDRLVSQVALGIALYTVGAWTTNRTAARVALTVLTSALLIAMTVGLVVDLEAVATANARIPVVSVVALTVVGNLIGLTALLSFGETSWRSAHRSALVDTQTRQLIAEQKRSENAALAEQRIRIARDLHDAVAHHISIISLHAGAARLATGPDAASAPALARIEASARDAVLDVKRILTTLRSDEDASSSSSESLSLVTLASLVEHLQTGDGSPVFLVEGTPRELRPVVGSTVVRVAQEAVTNIRKHGGPTAHAAITLRYDDDAITLIVENTTREDDRRPTGTGLGALGMRERAAAVGGSLNAGLELPGYRLSAGYTLSLVVPA